MPKRRPRPTASPLLPLLTALLLPPPPLKPLLLLLLLPTPPRRILLPPLLPATKPNDRSWKGGCKAPLLHF